VTAFSFDIIGDVQQMLRYQFMVNAFEAGGLVAILAGLVGYLVILRRSTFASHALAHSGFAGGAAAALLGVNPVFGLLLFTMSGGAGMATLGRRASQRDLETGTVLAFLLGLGLLFVSLYRGSDANLVYSLLFGEILGISQTQVVITSITFVILLVVLAITFRPLLFSALDEDVAEARGMSMLGFNVLFLLLVAVTVSLAVQVVGVLLIFSLTVTPAAIAVRLSKRPTVAVALAVGIALAATWAGLFVAWYEQFPVSFFITSIVFLAYLVVRLAQWAASGRRSREVVPQGHLERDRGPNAVNP
jgi:zinc/manganese transport system permease protein